MSVLLAVVYPPVLSATTQEVQSRITRDLADGRPVVVHITVALCDNANQGIVPVPKHLGNGQDPRSNLYWGAMYGVRTHFSRRAGWTAIPVKKPSNPHILERVGFFSHIRRAGEMVPAYVVADAWDGVAIQAAVGTFLSMSAGGNTEEVAVRHEDGTVHLAAGGSSHVVGYVGHNGLMDFALPRLAERAAGARANSAIVLACASKPYFLDVLRSAGAQPLLLTTGLMAPEAYSLDAALRSWIAGDSVSAVREAAARAYAEYQPCGLGAARNLFWGESP